MTKLSVASRATGSGAGRRQGSVAPRHLAELKPIGEIVSVPRQLQERQSQTLPDVVTEYAEQVTLKNLCGRNAPRRLARQTVPAGNQRASG